MMQPPPCIVLAGGLSRRFGGYQKSLVHLNQKPLIQHVIEKLAPQTSSICINANDRLKDFQFFDRPIVQDTIKGHLGPLAGIVSGLEHFKTSPYILSSPTDTPFLPDDLVERLITAAINAPGEAVVAASRGRSHYTIALWPTNIRQALHTWLTQSDNRRMQDWLEQVPHRTVNFEDLALKTGAMDPFFNINTLEDLNEAAQTKLLEKNT